MSTAVASRTHRTRTVGRRWWSWPLVFLVVLSVAMPGSSGAVDFTVDSMLDEPDADLGDNVCVSSPGGFCTLRAAIQQTNALGSADSIDVPAGAYTLSRGAGDDNALNGDLDLVGTVTITGAGSGSTFIDGGGLDRVFDVLAGTVASIAHVTVRNGSSSTGGGIQTFGSLTLTDSTVTMNTGTSEGGGLYLGTGGSLTLTRVEVRSNDGGSKGAGIFAKDAAVLSLSEVTIDVNGPGTEGGGLRVESVASVSITDSTVSGNWADKGGGLFFKGTSSPVLTNVTISGNTAATNGGGIRIDSNALTLTNVTMSGNSAPDGAAIKEQAGGGTVTLTNTIIANSDLGAYCAGSIIDTGSNLADDASCGTIPATLVNLDSNLADNGGPTWTHALDGGSNAIDYVSADNLACPSRDQRGFARGDGSCDVGAYEVATNDIVIDGDVSDWGDGFGNEVCRTDSGGQDDWTSPATLDITRFCAASNQVDTVYLLFGFDDATLSGGGTSTACVLVDTDPGGNNAADYLVCSVLGGPGATTVDSVELYRCPDDNAADGCPNAQLEKTYSPATDYRLSNDQDGPFASDDPPDDDPDSAVELAVPWSDLGISGAVVFFDLISYPGKSFLVSPKDSIFGLGNVGWVDYNVQTGFTTPVVLTSFSAAPGAGGVVVEWETAAEVNSAGFYLYRWDRTDRRYVQVNDELLPAALGSAQGSVYQILDPDASFGRALRYALVEVVAGGGEEVYGPFDVRAEGRIDEHPDLRNARMYVEPREPSGTRAEAASQKKSRGSIDRQRSVTANPLDGRDAVRSMRHGGRDRKATAPRLKISLSAEGLYALSARDLASAWQLPVGQVISRLHRGLLDLRRGQESVAWHVGGNGQTLYFYGEASDNPYSEESVYWLSQKPGVRMEVSANRRLPAIAGGGSSFRETLHFEENVMPVTVVAGVPPSDFWFWSYISAGSSSYASSQHEVRLPGVSPSGGEAGLTLELRSMTSTPAVAEHHAVVRVNGSQVGEVTWDDARVEVAELRFPQRMLTSGLNVVGIEGVLDEAPYSVFLVDSIAVTYERLTQAENDVLTFEQAGESVTVTGFSEPDVLVFDISDPRRPLVVPSVGVICDGYCRASIPMASAARTYLAVAASAALQPAAVNPTEMKNLRELPAAEYLVISPRQLLAGAERLAQLRRSDGLSTLVVALEDVYNELASGEATPLAIKRFLRHAWEQWREPPSYVVLVGAGTFDYKDLLGHGGNLIPPLLVVTPHGLHASDVALADVEGDDGVPEMAIGRIPAATLEELAAYLEKIEAQHRPGGLGPVVLLADNPDDAGNFPMDSEAVANLFSEDTAIDRIYLSTQSLAEARQDLAVAFDRGVTLLNYIGHGGIDRLADEGLLLAAEAEDLGRLGSLPVMAAFTCNVGRFEIPGFSSLAASLVLAPQAGALAVWSPSGQSFNAEARHLNREFVRFLAVNQSASLGEAVVHSLRQYGEQGGHRFILDMYGILGDPAARVN